MASSMRSRWARTTALRSSSQSGGRSRKYSDAESRARDVRAVVRGVIGRPLGPKKYENTSAYLTTPAALKIVPSATDVYDFVLAGRQGFAGSTGEITGARLHRCVGFVGTLDRHAGRSRACGAKP